MATRYIYGIKSFKYGVPTGSNTMPEALTALPDTVKGSVSIDESEGSFAKFFTDQKKDPIKVIKTEEGLLTVVAQFYDMTFTHMAAFKGGTAPTSGGYDKFVPATGYTEVEKAIEMEFDSGEKLNMFNANCFSRIIGGGGRDKMFAMEIKMEAQMTDDLAGSWEFSDAQ